MEISWCNQEHLAVLLRNTRPTEVASNQLLVCCSLLLVIPVVGKNGQDVRDTYLLRSGREPERTGNEGQIPVR